MLRGDFPSTTPTTTTLSLLKVSFFTAASQCDEGNKNRHLAVIGGAVD